MEFIFWFSIIYIAFIYAGYGLVVWIINKISPGNTSDTSVTKDLPTIAVVIAAYNEEEVIRTKLLNTLSLEYPVEKLTIYVISDGSIDHTNEIISGFKNVNLFWQQKRNGKTAAINRIMPFITEEITVFTDSNVMLNKAALKSIVRHYANQKTGAVSGEKRVMSGDSTSAAATEGLYWKYESFLKKQDAQLSSIIGAAGELFSIRTSLYRALPKDTLLDDFMISMNIIRQGYVVAYEPMAYASEAPSYNIKEEYVRKVRISAGGLQTAIRLPDFLNPFRYGIVSLQYFFHRFSRWVITPALLPIAFIVNLLIAGESPLYMGWCIAQVAFHLAAIAGWYFESRNIRIKLLFIPFYFDFMHYCQLAGWVKYLSGRQQATWQKARRVVTV